jgi:plasmid stabilization system protein ParE
VVALEMSRRLLFRRNVERELAEAVDWYEAQSVGLGTAFLMEFDAALARIVDNPYQYQIIDDDIRRAPLHRHPYGIMYVVSEDEVLILTCFHGSRDPQHWRELRGR